MNAVVAKKARRNFIVRMIAYQVILLDVMYNAEFEHSSV